MARKFKMVGGKMVFEGEQPGLLDKFFLIF